MENKEQVIVSLTTYSNRIGNIPVVLDSIFAQTRTPDKVVLNLAYEDVIPENVQRYIDIHSVEINRVSDTKVYKKLIPTLKKYPDDCIITIDDDFIYPLGMIEDFVSVHNQYPKFPISGNRDVFFGFQCHCGCASLTKACYLGSYLNSIDDDVIKNCPSDDIVYTFFSIKNGHPYVRTRELYFTNMQPYNEGNGYTSSNGGGDSISKSFNYLVRRFGDLPDHISDYIKDGHIARLVTDILLTKGRQEGRDEIFSSKTYKLGSRILKPVRSIVDLFCK